MKTTICAVIGAVLGAVTSAIGGWSAGLTTLCIFMAADYLSGLIVAGVFHRSNKTPGGGLESRAGWKGLVRKGMTLLIVLVACRLDLMLSTTYVRDGAVIAFCVNEALSIVENAGLMGVPIPAVVARAIEVLQKSGERIEGEEETP